MEKKELRTIHIEGENFEFILLTDYKIDRVSVARLLGKLEDLDVIRYSLQKRNTLDFFRRGAGFSSYNHHIHGSSRYLWHSLFTELFPIDLA